MTTINPLMAFKPHTKVYVKLPSGGNFYTPDIIDAIEEHGVLALSAKEEMILSNPELLMNGKAIQQVISSCVPTVHDASKLAIADVEALLLAVKLATGESTYNISASCPKCNQSGEFSRDIESLLDNTTTMKDEYTYDLQNGLIVFLKPNTWASHSIIQQITFKQQKILQAAGSEDISDTDRTQLIETAFKELVEMNMRLLLDCIAYINTPNSIVQNKEFIAEYIGTLSKVQITDLGSIVERINATGIPHELQAVCNKCKHEWTITGLKYDPSHFFG
jgi:hypothetical protein